ncbi:MAG: LacI family transcriptional regulator [Clostridiales bacterium]|jgi:LacI family transcriptional regulator|nr:LacI family transcriptional regulator [Clostridiales bacterium]
MKVTINDIAKLANVSKTTVSKVINNKAEGVGEETRKKILKIIEELNYQPSAIARGLVTKRTHSIGLIIPDIANPFFPQLARGVEDIAIKNGYNVFLCNSDNDVEKEEGYIKAFIDKSVDGMILTSSTSISDSHYQALKEKKIPFILVDRYIEGIEGGAGVFSDNKEGAYKAVNYLLEHGHEKIAFISGPLSITTALHRLNGYQAAHYDKGIEIDYDLVQEGNYHFKSGFEFIEQLITAKKKFSAVFAANDMIAIGVVKALKKHNIKIPDDVEVIGFDDIDTATLVEPALSTVAQPIYDMGALGAAMLIKMIEGKEIDQKNIYLKSELVLRETTRRE